MKTMWFNPTFYLKLKLPDEHLRLFGECKEAVSDLNMVVYNLPSIAGSSIPIEVICEMTRRGWITCCKDTSEDMAHFGRLVSEAGPLGLGVLIGSELHASEALLKGAQGLVPVSANCEPGTYIAAYEARKNPGKNETDPRQNLKRRPQCTASTEVLAISREIRVAGFGLRLRKARISDGAAQPSRATSNRSVSRAMPVSLPG